MDPGMVRELGVVLVVLLVSNHAITFGRELLRTRLNGSPRNRADGPIPHDEQAARVIYDVSRTMSEVATNMERQLELSARLLTAIEGTHIVLQAHDRRTADYILTHK